MEDADAAKSAGRVSLPLLPDSANETLPPPCVLILVRFFANILRITNMYVMKGARSQNNMQSKQFAGHRPRPDIRDDIDSRSKEEQFMKGDDESNNAKDVRSQRPGRGRKGSRK